MGGVHPEGGELHHLLLLEDREGQSPGENGAGSDELGILRDIALQYFSGSVKLSDISEQLIIDHRNSWHTMD